MTNAVTVIIPTLATRPMELERAIASVKSQVGVEAVPLVVVNGDRHDAGEAERLGRRTDIRFHRIGEPSVSAARLAGRRMVETPFFAFLDDDDELLPDALRLRLGALADRAIDMVATNGYRQREGRREIIFPGFDQEPEDHARALLEENWLASAGGLYRTETVGEECFEGLPDFLEMTLLAFRMAHDLAIVRLNAPTFVIHAGAGDQASRSWRYYQETPAILRRMQAMTPRRDLVELLKSKEAAALHDASVKAFENRDRLNTWKYHLRTLAMRQGLKYLPYTRHIVLP